MDLTLLLEQTAPTDRKPTVDALSRARARMDDEVRAATLRVRLARRSRRRRAALVSVVSIAAAAAFVIAPAVDLGGVHRPDSAEAAAVLVSAATAAGSQAGGWPDAAYWHVVATQETPEGTFPREIWIGRLGTTALQDGALDDASGDSIDGILGPDGVYTMDLGRWTFLGGDVPRDWAGLYALPTDPTELERILRKSIEEQELDHDSGLWELIGSLQRESPASPALRAALWTVASRIPGVEVVGTVTDSAGRKGTAVERDETDIGWHRMRFVIDPDTGNLLEEVSYDKTGTVIGRTTILSQGPTDTAPDIDPPVCGPGSVPEHSC